MTSEELDTNYKSFKKELKRLMKYGVWAREGKNLQSPHRLTRLTCGKVKLLFPPFFDSYTKITITMDDQVIGTLDRYSMFWLRGWVKKQSRQYEKDMKKKPFSDHLDDIKTETNGLPELP